MKTDHQYFQKSRPLQDALEELNADDFDWSDPSLDRRLEYGFSLYGGDGRKIFSESFFNDIRSIARRLYLTNPYAINAIENRVNFVVGKGHRYHAVPKSPEARPLARSVQREIDEFVEINEWSERQQEIQRRKDRDGEVFLRFFRNKQGRIIQRFIEPAQIYTPTSVKTSPQTSLGIQTDKNDAENVLGYWVDAVYVPAANIQHRKCNVDSNFKRGISLLFPIRKNLVRAEKLLRNMSIVAEIQSAIALIRKHTGASSDSIRRYLQNQSSPKSTDSIPFYQRFAPGTIIDASGGIDYEFPIAAIDASRYIQVLQAELRAIASRLLMPEYMLSSDASNANYSSTMVAESPAIRMFERLQTEMIRDDLAVLRRVINAAILRGSLPANIDQYVGIQAVPPTLSVRDRLSEAKADEILVNHRVISPQTMAMRYGLDPLKEHFLWNQWDNFEKAGKTTEKDKKEFND